MSIKTRMIALFTSIFGLLLVLFCILIYFEGEVHRTNEFILRLKSEAIKTSTIFFNKDEISPDLLHILDKNNITALENEETVILDLNSNKIYESGNDQLSLSEENISKIKLFKEYYWKEKQNEFLGIIINKQKQDYIVVTAANDKYGLEKQSNLLLMLVLGGLAMLAISAAAGFYFTSKLLMPLKKIINSIDEITAKNLNTRLNVSNTKDELAQLSERFNIMLNRIEKAFNIQKSFVSHASHELRTPLTSITGQIQVSLLANDDLNDLKLMIHSVLEDVQQLNKLSNNLLEITSLDAEEYLDIYSSINLLEIFTVIKNEILKKDLKAKINLFDYNDELQHLVKGNQELLYLAFLNLIENGLKFSEDNCVNIKFIETPTTLKVYFQNYGKLINSEELELIFEPFKRGENSRKIKGHGVGLSLIKKIITLHNGTITVISNPSEGTVFNISLPKI